MNDERIDAKPPSSTTYEVGYGRPPVAQRFKKGTSGNPKGRPRKVTSIGFGDVGGATFDNTLLKVVREPVRIRTADGKWTQTSIIEGVLRHLSVAAANGDKTVQLSLARMVSSAQRRTQKERERHFIELAKYKTDAIADIKKARAEGRPDPVIFPNPLDMVFDPFTLNVTINGPMTHEDNAVWEAAQAFVTELEQKIADAKASIEMGSEDLQDIRERIALLEKAKRRSSTLYPDEKTRRHPGFDLVTWQKEQLGAKELKRLLRGE